MGERCISSVKLSYHSSVDDAKAGLEHHLAPTTFANWKDGNGRVENDRTARIWRSPGQTACTAGRRRRTQRTPSIPGVPSARASTAGLSCDEWLTNTRIRPTSGASHGNVSIPLVEYE
jgi:hypothetical protein